MPRAIHKNYYLTKAMLDLAFAVSEAATCERAKVGCVLTTPNLRQVVGYGFNGAASGEEHTCIRNQPGKCGCLHAETNSAIFASPGPKWAFITIPPCEMCAGLLINADVQKVIYGKTAHRDYQGEGENRLDRAGIWCGTWEEYVKVEGFSN